MNQCKAGDALSVRLKEAAGNRRSLLLLYWPLYLLMYLFVERVFPVETYHPVYCALDDLLPFQELFLIPYLLWFAELVFMTLYPLLKDRDVFCRYMWYTILTYTTAMCIYIYMIYPTCQNLRVETFARDNVLTRIMGFLYTCDTNTNVCPSIHVLGAMGTLFAALRLECFRHPVRKLLWGLLTVLICLSTVFLKQHSVLDIVAALPLACLAGWLCFGRRERDVQ